MLFPFCLTIVALTFVGLAVLVRAAFAAPYGVEDERGFQFVAPSSDQSAKLPETAVVSDLAFFHR